MEWEQQKPLWCPHPQDCIFKRRVMDSLCVGKLVVPQPHNGDLSTHRICLTGALPDEKVFDLQVNKGDAYHFRRILNVIDGL